MNKVTVTNRDCGIYIAKPGDIIKCHDGGLYIVSDYPGDDYYKCVRLSTGRMENSVYVNQPLLDCWELVQSKVIIEPHS